MNFFDIKARGEKPVPIRMHILEITERSYQEKSMQNVTEICHYRLLVPHSIKTFLLPAFKNKDSADEFKYARNM